MENISLAFRCEYEKSEEKDIVKFAEKYLKDEINNEKKWRKGKISCCTYFGEGSMDECDCGFENFFNIFYELGLKNNMSDKKLKDHALNILSNKRKFVGKEYYCGRLEGVGEIY